MKGEAQQDESGGVEPKKFIKAKICYIEVHKSEGLLYIYNSRPHFFFNPYISRKQGVNS